MFSFLSSTAYNASIELTGEKQRSCWPPTGQSIYYDGEDIEGRVLVNMPAGKVLEHYGIKIEFVGACSMWAKHAAGKQMCKHRIMLKNDSAASLEFICIVRELQGPGALASTAAFPFEFQNVEKRFESYIGRSVCLRYFLRVTVTKSLANIVRERDIWVVGLQPPPPVISPIKLEVGIEHALHIEFEYQRAVFELHDAIIGRVYFGLVRVRLTHAELAIVCRETVGVGTASVINDATSAATWEIMDGAPAKGETLAIRVFLKGLNLQPTMHDVCKRFSVRWYLNFQIFDEDGRRYFKQHEIVLWRREKV